MLPVLPPMPLLTSPATRASAAPSLGGSWLAGKPGVCLCTVGCAAGAVALGASSLFGGGTLKAALLLLAGAGTLLASMVNVAVAGPAAAACGRRGRTGRTGRVPAPCRLTAAEG